MTRRQADDSTEVRQGEGDKVSVDLEMNLLIS